MMNFLVGLDAGELISDYGYLALAVVLGLESAGLPLPGETLLITAAIYAATTHRLDISLVILAAAVGAILGDNIGFWIGRTAGFRMLQHYGARVGLTERRLKLGQYLFLLHGGKVVFIGRFFAVLRVLAALLAGANGMIWPRFLLFNALGAVVWASLYGTGAYLLGDAIHRIVGPLSMILVAGAVLLLAATFVLLRRHERALEDRAERALPGPLRNIAQPSA